MRVKGPMKPRDSKKARVVRRRNGPGLRKGCEWNGDQRVPAPASIIFWIFSRLNEPGVWLGG